MSDDLGRVMRKSQSWTRYFKSVAIQDSIEKWRRQIDGRRDNFTVCRTLVAIDGFHLLLTTASLAYDRYGHQLETGYRAIATRVRIYMGAIKTLAFD